MTVEVAAARGELHRLRDEFEAGCDSDARVEIAAVLEQLRQGPAAFMYVETEPTATTRRLANEAVVVGQRLLGIRGVTVKFMALHHGPRWPVPDAFVANSDAYLSGLFTPTIPGTVWTLAAFYGGLPLVRTIVHELRHCERFRAGVTFPTREASEDDAYEYAERVAPQVLCEVLVAREKERLT